VARGDLGNEIHPTFLYKRREKQSISVIPLQRKEKKKKDKR